VPERVEVPEGLPPDGGALADEDRLILEAATGARRLSRRDLQRIREHVARAGFDPTPDPRGRTAAENHYRKHVEGLREWPDATTREAYLASVQRVILDDRSGVLTSRYQGQWQIAFLRRPEELRGPRGTDWVVVEYRVGLGYWVTAFQPRDLERDFLRRPAREEIRWLRRRT
jgi:hypothetical protein